MVFTGCFGARSDKSSTINALVIRLMAILESRHKEEPNGHLAAGNKKGKMIRNYRATEARIGPKRF